jgi:hypothetical protein
VKPVILFLAATVPTLAYGAQITTNWTGAASSDWQSPANWSAGVPSNAADTYIANFLATNTSGISVDLNGAAYTIERVALNQGAALSVGNGKLVLKGDAASGYTGVTVTDSNATTLTRTIAADLELSPAAGTFEVRTGATLAGSGSITTSGLTVAGTLAPGEGQSNGTFTVTGLLKIGNDADLILGGTLPASGAVVLATYGSLAGSRTAFDAPSGYRIDYAYNGNQIALVAVPEPAAAALLAVALPLLRRRTK